MDKARKVMVVYGRDAAIKEALFDWLRAVDLRPQEWEELVVATGSATPYTGQVLDAAMATVQAVVVLFTPDDLARLRADLLIPSDGMNEQRLNGQPRANVLFEAGLAFGRHPDRTILVEHGNLRGLSDLAGRNAVRLERGTAALADLANRLRQAGCAINNQGSEYLDPSRFPSPPDLSDEADGNTSGMGDGDLKSNGVSLDRLIGEIVAASLPGDPASDLVRELAQRLRSLDRPIRRSELFDGLPGRRMSNDVTRQIIRDLERHDVLLPNPDKRVRGYVRGMVLES